MQTERERERGYFKKVYLSVRLTEGGSPWTRSVFCSWKEEGMFVCSRVRARYHGFVRILC
jgi:hypothetical protein